MPPKVLRLVNTREELMDAFRDFQEGNMGSLAE